MSAAVSAIICARDRPPLLARALASVLAQLGPGDDLLCHLDAAAGGGRHE